MNAPILLILFNRPDLTAGLLDIVRGQRGRKIYIAADGVSLEEARMSPFVLKSKKWLRDRSDRREFHKLWKKCDGWFAETKKSDKQNF